MARERRQITPALIVSVVVHAGVIALVLLAVPRKTPPLPFGSAVPVTIVSNAPKTDVSQAAEAPETVDALTEEPIPDVAPAVLAPPAPTPIPAPPEVKTPPKPAEKPKPTPTPTPTPKPSKPTPPTKQAELNFDDLEKRLQKAGGGQARPGGGQKGPDRPATAPIPRPDGKGKGLNASSIQGLVTELNKRWEPNCAVEGGSKVKLTVQIKVSPSGQLLGEPKIIRGMSSDPIVQAAATKAKLAITASLPFRNLPDEYVGEDLNLNFDAQSACRL